MPPSQRTDSYQTAPAQVPSSGTVAPGFSEILTSAQGLPATKDGFQKSAFRATHEGWFGDVELFQKLLEAEPIVTLSPQTIMKTPARLKKEIEMVPFMVKTFDCPFELMSNQPEG